MVKGTDISLIQVLSRYGNSKTMETYTPFSKKSLANIKSPLDAIIESQDTLNQNIKGNKSE
jgi:hypothetical protein